MPLHVRLASRRRLSRSLRQLVWHSWCRRHQNHFDRHFVEQKHHATGLACYSLCNETREMESNSSVPSAGSRRVSILIALPVILTCAVTGSVLGVTHPIRSFFSFVDPSERTVEPAAAPQASASDKPDVEAAATPPPPAPPSATTAEEPRAAVARAGEERSGAGVPAAMPLPPPPSPSLALPAFPAAEPAPVSTGSV